MKAVVWTKYGAPDSLQIREVPTPSPNDHQVLIKVHAATVSTPDSEFRRLNLPFLYAVPLRLYLGVFRPMRITILGTEFAGEIVEVGREVTQYKAGDQMFGYTGLSMGTYAEFLCLSEKPTAMASMMAPKPVNVTYEEAAALSFGALEALHALRKAEIQKGQKILIVGAGGNIGTFAVQLAKHYGAEVTGVDKAGKLEMLRSIGADYVIDYAKEDFTQRGQKYDVIFDTIGKSPFMKSLRLLTDHGAYLNANPGLLGGMRMRREAKASGKRIMPWSAPYTTEYLLEVKELVEAGTLRAIIDRRYPMEQIVDAHRYVDTGQKKGNVVMTIGV